MAELVARPHWLSDKGEICFQRKAGRTLRQCFTAAFIETAIERSAVCYVNGKRCENWLDYTLQQDDHILLTAMPLGGGGSNKQLLSSIAMIGLAFAAPHIAAGMGFTSTTGIAVGAGVFASYGATAAITIGGSLVLGLINNALIKPPPQPSLAPSNPFYALSGSSNQMNPWGTVPRVYGRMKVAPTLMQRPTTYRMGQDQYLYQIYDFGYGPLKLIAGTDKIGNDPVTSFDLGGSGRYVAPYTFKRGDSLKISNRKTTAVGVGATLRKGDSREVTLPSNTGQVELDFTLPRGLVTTTTHDNSQHAGLVQFRLEVKVGGSWQPASSFASISFSDPVASGGLTINKVFPVRTRTCTGLGKNRVCTWSRASVGTNGIPIRVPATFQSMNAHVFVVPYKLRPRRIYGQLVDGVFYPDNPAENSVIGTVSELYIYEDDPLHFWIQDRILSPIAVTTTLSFNNVNQVTAVRVTRVNSDDLNDYSQSELLWTQVQHVDSVDAVIKPDVTHTIAELRIKATDQLQGSVDSYNAIVESILPVYNGTTWTDQATRNPAWIFCDILKGIANKKPITDAQIDLDEMRAWAAECDQLVNGKPRYACDMVIGSQTTVKEALQAVAAVGRASPTIRDGKISVIRESTKTNPVQLITPKNSIGLSASMAYAGKIHGLKVTFLDANENYESVEERVYNDGYDINSATVLDDLDLPGITDRDQAIKAARYFMAEGQLRRERATVTMDIENLIAQRGDLVYLAHDVLDVGGEPLRVLSVAGNLITVDEALPTGSNAVRLRGQTAIQSITQTAPYQFTIGAGHSLQVGDVLEWGVSTSLKADYLVEEIQPGVDLSATLTLVEYRPEILAVDNKPIPDRIPKPGIDINNKLNGVQALHVLQTERITDRIRYADLTLHWVAPKEGFADRYLVYDLNADKPLLLGETKDTKWPLDALSVSQLKEDKTVNYGVVAVSGRNYESDLTTVQEVIRKDSIVPADVQRFGSNILTSTIHLFWDRVFDRDLSHYELRYSSQVSATANWAQSSIVADEIPYDATSITVPARTGTYFIKAVDTAGNYSKKAAQTMTTIELLEQLDLRDTIDFSDLLGTFDNTEVKAGGLTLTEGFTEGWWYADAKIDLGSSPWLMRLIAQLELSAYSVDETLAGPYFTPLSTAIPLSQAALAQDSQNVVDAQIYFKRDFGTPDAVLSDAYFSPLSAAIPLSSSAGKGFGDWQRLLAADVEAAKVEFAIRLTTKDITMQPIVTGAKVLADWHERVEKDTDISIGAAGTDIKFKAPFAPISATIKRPSVAISLQNAAAGDTVVLLPHSTLQPNEGFKVQILSATGVAKTGSIDWQALGTGKGY